MSREKVHRGGNHHRENNPSKTLGSLWVCLVWINLHRTREACSESISTILTRQRRWVKERAADSHNVQNGFVEGARGRYLVLLANYSIHTGNFIQFTFSEISSEVWFSLHRQIMSLGKRVCYIIFGVCHIVSWRMMGNLPKKGGVHSVGFTLMAAEIHNDKERKSFSTNMKKIWSKFHLLLLNS